MANFDLKRLPIKAARQLKALMDGGFLDRKKNLLLFGNPDPDTRMYYLVFFESSSVCQTNVIHRKESCSISVIRIRFDVKCHHSVVRYLYRFAQAAFAGVRQKCSPRRESLVDAFCAAKQRALKGIRGSKEGRTLCFGLALTAFVIKFRCVQLGLCEGCVSAF
jgi:hypothetical protein